MIKIVMNYRQSEKKLEVDVIDSGMGIREDDLNRLF